MMAMFTKIEAVAFLADKWGVKRVEERLLTDRKNLIDEIVVLVHINVNFQTVTLLAVPPSERRRPTVAEIKRDGMSGVGGNCYCVNVFTWGLLKGLGFNVQLCPSSCTFVDTGRTNHVILLVNDLTKAGDLHLVDCATQTPTFRAVPLDFEVESPVYQESFLEYKYIRHDGKILRMHGRGDPVRHRDPPREGLDFIVGKWRRFYCFEIRPTDNLSDLDTAFDRIFTDVEATPTHKILRAFRFPNKKAVMIFNEKLMVEEDGEIQTTVMKGDEEIVANVKKYFPEIKEETFRAALKRWRETFGRLPFDL